MSDAKTMTMPDGTVINLKDEEARGNIGGDEYSASSTYAVGDYCIHNNTLYVCNTAISTAEAWDSGKWTATDIITEVRETNASLVNLTNLIKFEDFNASYNLASNSRNNESIDISSLGLTNTNQILAITLLVDQPAWVHSNIYNNMSTTTITIGLNNSYTTALTINVKLRVLYTNS